MTGNYAAMKRDLEAVFHKITEKAQSGELPEESDTTAMLRILKQLQPFADLEWANEWDDFALLADELHQAIKNKEVQDAIMLVDSLSESRDFCHESFKS